METNETTIQSEPIIQDEAIGQDEPTTRSELFKFGALALILIFVVLVIALLRPLIFETIVPRVMGEGIPLPALLPEDNNGSKAPETDEGAVDTPRPEDADTAVDADTTEVDEGIDTAVDADAALSGETGTENNGRSETDTTPATSDAETGTDVTDDAAVVTGDPVDTTDPAATGDETEDSESAADSDTVVDEPAVPVSTNMVEHIVKTNETLTTIAAQYGVSIQAILDANQLPNPNRILVGSTLLIPQPAQ